MKIYGIPFLVIWSLVFLSSGAGVLVSIPFLVEANILLVAFSFNIVTAFALKRFVELYGDPEGSDYKFADNADELFEQYKISKREKEIVLLICQGKSNQQIADELFISIATVKDHIHHIFQKTSVRNRVQLYNLFR